jgi:type II secretory pathway component PulF
MTYSLDKQKDMFISLDLYLQQEGPFMHQFMMFYDTLELKEQTFWVEAVRLMQSGASFEESIEGIKSKVDTRIYPFLLLLGNHKKPHEITTMIITRLEHILSMKRMKKNVLKYPKFLSILLMICILAYLFIMIPMYETMFSRYTFETQALMKQLIYISQFLRQYPYLLIVIGCLIVVMYMFIQRIIQTFFPKIKYQVIFFKRISLTALYMDFTYMLSTFLKSHMTLKEALEHTLKLSPSYLEEGILGGISHITEGKPFTESFIELPSYPKDMEKLIMHAQEESQLIGVLTLLSKRYHMSYETQLEKYIQALTPILMMILGSLILAMFYMIYAPILNMYDMVEFS